VRTTRRQWVERERRHQRRRRASAADVVVQKAHRTAEPDEEPGCAAIAGRGNPAGCSSMRPERSGAFSPAGSVVAWRGETGQRERVKNAAEAQCPPGGQSVPTSRAAPRTARAEAVIGRTALGTAPASAADDEFDSRSIRRSCAGRGPSCGRSRSRGGRARYCGLGSLRARCVAAGSERCARARRSRNSSRALAQSQSAPRRVHAPARRRFTRSRSGCRRARSRRRPAISSEDRRFLNGLKAARAVGIGSVACRCARLGAGQWDLACLEDAIDLARVDVLSRLEPTD